MNTPARKVVAVVQARMNSKRLPGKVMADVGGMPLIGHILQRVRLARSVDEAWLATSARSENDPLAIYATDQGVQVFRGDEEDVLSRFAAIAQQSGATVIVRICGDCPLIDPGLIDEVVAKLQNERVDYASNTLERSYPDGLDVEAFSRQALDQADREAKLPFLRAHVTPYMHGRLKDKLPWGGFRIAGIRAAADFGHLRWTVDEAEDLDMVRRLVKTLPQGYRWQDALAQQTRDPDLLHINKGHVVYEGTNRDLKRFGHDAAKQRQYEKSNTLFARAMKTIPLGSQTFSKSHQQWVRGAAPLFIERGQGCRVVDVDGNTYIDYVMALLPVVLGYRDPDVDSALRAQIDQGIVFSLASPLETALAERLSALIPCAEKVRFGKNGSDVTTAAIRLARAYTRRDKVLICGYHGWHDWYIGTTTRDLGVPSAVKALADTFAYNDGDALARKLAAEPDAYAAVILEPAGASAPAPGFLQYVRDLTQKHGVVLIFDEIITGFRIALGGAQSHYGVVPDLACFGKSMANGMPISALVGRAELMSVMEDIFFSGTFGGEALSIAAALATIDKLERLNVPDRLRSRGNSLKQGANQVLARYGFSGMAEFVGDGWWPRLDLRIPAADRLLVTSLFRQEFCANGLLLAQSFNLCLDHDRDEVESETMAAFDAAVAVVRDALNSADPKDRLRGLPIQPTFSVR